MTLHFIPLSVSLVLLFGARAANAACVISGVRPTVALPTVDAGQQFSFLATADCAKLRFRVPGTTFVAVPKAGPGTGTRDRTYKVVLSESEWSSLVGESDTTFTWSIIGTTSAGVTTRVTTTNELRGEGGATIDLSMADAKLVGEESGDYAGRVSGAGDVDGDGHDDLLIGAYGNAEGGEIAVFGAAGAAYLVLGPVTGTLDLSMADAKLVGEEAGDEAGYCVSGAGDVDGDGHDDLLIGAPGDDEASFNAGAAYLRWALSRGPSIWLSRMPSCWATRATTCLLAPSLRAWATSTTTASTTCWSCPRSTTKAAPTSCWAR